MVHKVELPPDDEDAELQCTTLPVVTRDGATTTDTEDFLTEFVEDIVKNIVPTFSIQYQ